MAERYKLRVSPWEHCHAWFYENGRLLLTGVPIHYLRPRYIFRNLEWGDERSTARMLSSSPINAYLPEAMYIDHLPSITSGSILIQPGMHLGGYLPLFTILYNFICLSSNLNDRIVAIFKTSINVVVAYDRVRADGPHTAHHLVYIQRKTKA
jgi:hypothetical protein